MNCKLPQGQSHDRALSRRTLLRASGAAAAFGLASRLFSNAYVVAADAKPGVRREPFGQLPDGRNIDVFTLTNDHGCEARVMNYGATLLSLKVPDRHGKLDSVTLYLDTPADYVKGPLLGSVVGRFANRISNARFAIDGKEYNLLANAKPHHIHGGGDVGFHKQVWSAEPIEDAGFVGVRLRYISPNGEAGYPGTVVTHVEYRVSRSENALSIAYEAKTDRPTHVNLTNHAYWNLAGAGSGDMLKHELQLEADAYLEADAARIPTGKLLPVTGTPMDFTKPMLVGSRLGAVDGQNYDHCYVLRKRKWDSSAPRFARVFDPSSGRVMEVATTQPGVQFFTGKSMKKIQTRGLSYGPYHGLCLETQHYPDSPNRPNFPSTLLRPGETLRQSTTHSFLIA